MAKIKIPNVLTWIRIAIIPIFVIAYYLPFNGSNWIAAVLFVLAGITDWLDGYLARLLNQTSRFGAFLDPVADKLMVAVALVLLVANPHLPYIAIPAAVIVGREIVVSALREWMAEIGSRASVAVGFIGKVKTVVQIIAVIGLLIYNPKSGYGLVFFVSYFFLYLAAVLTLWSMCMYLRAAWPMLQAEEETQSLEK